MPRRFGRFFEGRLVLVDVENFIGGKKCPAISGGVMDYTAPATGKVHGRVPSSGEKDVVAAVAAAQKAFRLGRNYLLQSARTSETIGRDH